VLIKSTEITGFNRKTVLFVTVVASVMLLSAGLMSWTAEQYILNEAKERVRNLLLSHKGIHHYVQQVMLPAYAAYQDSGMIDSAFYAPEILSSSYIARNQHRFYNEELARAGLQGVYYKLAAKNPRNPVNIADSDELRMIELFNKDRQLSSYEEIVKFHGNKYLYVAIPFLENGPNCLRCHGNRNEAPVDLQRLYPGEGGFNEQVGEIRAITSIRAPLEHEFSAIYIFGFSAFSGSMAFVGLIVFNTVLRRSVTRKTGRLEREVIERKRAETVLSENQNMLRQILDTAPQSIFWKNRKGIYIGCNRNYALTVGLQDPVDILGKSDYDLPFPREEAEIYRRDDQQVMENDIPKIHIIEQVEAADGKRIWVDTTKIPLHDSEKRVYGVLGVYNDITEQKRVQEEKAELEQRLQQAQKMEAVGTLTGGIAHDFNNILAALYAYSDLAKSKAADQNKVLSIIQQMDQAHERAANLVKQLLAFSRKQDHNPEVLNVNQFIRDLSKMLNRLIGMDIEMIFDLSPADECILADPVQFEQILINLVVNARDALREKEGEGNPKHISIRTEAQILGPRDLREIPALSTGKHLRITVEDNGSGISSEDLPRIFEPFFTTKEVGKGTGLGLATIYGIIRQNNAWISVDSTPRLGSRFQILWPVTERPLSEISSPAAAVASAKGLEKILYVEDEELIRTAMSIALKDLGYQVNIARDGREAWDMIQSGTSEFDLIVTDITMPNMDGRELVRHVLKRCPNARIIACSGHSGETRILEDLRSLKVRFLQKPFTVRKLANEVRDVLDLESANKS